MSSQGLNWDRSASREFHLAPELFPASQNHHSLGANTSLPHFDLTPAPTFQPTSSHADFAAKAGSEVLKSRIPVLNSLAGKTIEHFVTTYEIGQRMQSNYREGLAAGHSPLSASTCGTLRAVTDVLVTDTLQATVVGVTIATAPPFAAFVAPNPILAPTIPVVLNSLVQTYQSAESIGNNAGHVVQSGCYKAFDAADAWN